MVVLAVAGIALLLGAPLIARVIAGRGNDPIALTRLLQAVAVVLLIAALLLRPSNPETSAVPGPPDAAPASER